MTWIADANLADIALWAALVLTGIVVGTAAIRWNDAGTVDRRVDAVLLTAAAAGVIAWFANIGSLLGGASANRLLLEHVPVVTGSGFRLAVLWATIPGAALTFGSAMLTWTALGRVPPGAARGRYVAAMAVVALLAVAGSLWFGTSPNAQPTHVPAFVQSAPAAFAPLLALVAVILMVEQVTTRIAGGQISQPTLRVAWLTATLAITAEQLARSGLGIGPRDAVIPGGASSGLILWLVTSALLHDRVQSLVLRTTRAHDASAPATTRLAHAGAALLVVSFAAHALATRHTISIPSGSSVDVSDVFNRTWSLANQGVSRFDADDAFVLSVAIEVRSPSGATSLVAPDIREVHGTRGQHLDNNISHRETAGSAIQALRVLLVDADSLDAASVRVTFLPLPFLWPLGVALMALSVLLAGTRRKPSHA